MESIDDSGSDINSENKRSSVNSEYSQTYPSELSDTQHTYCEVMAPEMNIPSQSIFSQDTELQDDSVDANQNIESSDNLPNSNDVEDVTKPVALVVLETDSSNENDTTMTISDSFDVNKTKQSVRRKSLDYSPIPPKRSCPQTDYLSVGSSTSLDLSPRVILERIDPSQTTVAISRNSPVVVKSPCVPIRSSPRLLTKRNNPYTVVGDLPALKPARRLKRSLSSDIDVRQKKNITCLSPSDLRKLTRIAENVCDNTTRDRNLINPSSHLIDNTENGQTETLQSMSGESESFRVNDSQNIKLYLSPSTYDNDSMKDDSQNNEHLVLSTIKQDDHVLHPHHSNGNDELHFNESHCNSGDFSNGDVQKSSSSGEHTDQDSTTSVDLDSPYALDLPEKITLKSKPYLSNGYSSSTPENGPFPESLHLKKTFLISDSEGDNTPPFIDYNKQPDGLSKLSITSKSDISGTRNNSTNSSLNNGHSNGSSHYSNTSNISIPTFNIQVYTDDNNDFLSMFIVKTDNDLGNHTLKEYVRLSRRLTVDPYAGDVSKSVSPSSVTSGGLLHLPPQPRSSFMSTTSSTSSSRTSDGAFVIPQRPRKTLSFQTQPSTVKGLLALKQKLDEILCSLSEVYGPEDILQSPLDDKPLNGTSQQKLSSKSPEHKAENNCSNRTTPKSSKKKIQTKTKRVLSGKNKRSDLSITNEEPLELDGINSPEMIATDPEKHQQPHSTFRGEKNYIEDNRGSPKSTPRIRKLKGISPTVHATCFNENNNSAALLEETPYPEGTLVLAKWVDKRYYTGKVKQVLDSNKYCIQFDDGHCKTLLDDFIIFGNMTELPLVGQSIYAMVDDQQTYEPSLVLEVEKNQSGTVCYKCTTDGNSMVSVVASEIYLTEDQAKSFKESNPPKSPHSAPGTPRRRVNRELDLDNIIQGPRSARLRDKPHTPKGFLNSPSSPKASTSFGARGKGSPKRRQKSESSEGGDSRASSGALEEVDGVQPEVQKTPRKIDGVRVRALPIKGLSKQIFGKKSSKLADNDDDTVSNLGPIPAEGSTLFSGLHFLLTCTDLPRSRHSKQSSPKAFSDSEQYTESSASTEKEEESMLDKIPFQKERLKEQLERGGGMVYSHFEDIPKNKYRVCKLISPRACLTAKYIQCLSANIRALSYLWIIKSCSNNKLMDQNEYILPSGWSFEKKRFIRWKIASSERGSTTPFKDKLILLCSDNNNFTKFWDRVCSLAGANTRILMEDNMEMGSGIAVVTDSDCPHEVRNLADSEGVPLISTSWVVQCLIEGKLLNFQSNPKYNFAYNDTE